MAAKDAIRIEYTPLSEIIRWPRNPKLHSLDDIGKSVERFGFVQPLLADERTKQLVAGHGRLETLQAMRAAGKVPPARITVGKGGEWLVPVVRGIAFKDDREAEAYLLADNRLVELGGWDQQAIADILRDAANFDGTGYTAESAAELMARLPALDPKDVVFKEFDESAANDVRMVECPSCKHSFPL